MATTSGKQLSVGVRYGAAFELNSSGLPNATSASAGCYEGLTFDGVKAFNLTIPEARRIVHSGEDRVQAVDFLPPLEAVTGEINVSKENYTLDALLSGVKEFAIGESDMIALGTNKQGSEPQIGLLVYQQSLDASTRLRRWRVILIPNARAIPMPGGMNENATEHRYMLAISPVNKHLWGVTLAENVEGATEAQIFRGMTEYKPKLVAFKGDGATTQMVFPTAYPAVSVDKISVFKNGAAVTTNITKAVDKVTFTTAPSSGDIVVIFYEHA